ncbi:hypothetical protein C7S14_6777 [Burkholderia cepacia]|nr:hypothetical protein [Burkholderia cepacia]QOH32801.1 hypothetical protein C7S14_6777 [Burkholderia cepacia]
MSRFGHRGCLRSHASRAAGVMPHGMTLRRRFRPPVKRMPC